MAKTKYRYRSRPKRKYGKRGGGGGGMKPIIDGLIVGAGQGFVGGFLGNWTAPAVYLGVGYFRHNNVLKTLGGIALGEMIGGGLGGLGGGSGGGGLFEG